MNYGRYKIVNELGRGSMGVVYKAHDPQIDRTIALKVLRADRVTSEDFVKRFLKEAMAVGRLSHPGIVTVYDVGQDNDTIYIAMEFLEGSPLDELHKARKFSHEEIVDIGLQTAKALLYAHQHGIVHRDIKPPNIIYSSEGIIKVTDFGIARIEDPNGHQLTQAGEILGTPLYMSPEQVMGQPLDGRSDLYSLGVILYLLTTGKRPFQESTLAAIFNAITNDNPEPPHLLNPDIPENLGNLIMQLLDKTPANRYASGGELLDQFRSCLSSPGTEAVEPVPVLQPELQSEPQQEEKSRSSKSRTIASGLLGLGICLALAGYFFLRPAKKQPPVTKQDPVVVQETDKPQQESARQPVTTTEKDISTPLLTNKDEQKSGDHSVNTPLSDKVPKDDTTVETIDQVVNIDPSATIRQGTALSVTINDLPKKELVLKSAQELVKISPRYQKDVDIAEKLYTSARDIQEQKLDLYLKELNFLHSNYRPDKLSETLAGVANGSTSARQKAVIMLIEDHLKSLQNGAKLMPAKVLKDYSNHFTDFVD